MLRRLLVTCAFGALVGVACGVAGAAFLTGLAAVTAARARHPWVPWLLPVGGAVMGRALAAAGPRATGGTSRVVDALRAAVARVEDAPSASEGTSGVQPSGSVPWELGFTAFLGTLATHLLGGSAGREGTAVQLGGSLAEGLRAWAGRWTAEGELTATVALSAGVAGGFGAVFGTPLAGTVFALELVGVRAWRRAPTQGLPALLSTACAAFVGDAVAQSLGATHTPFPAVEAVALTPSLVVTWILFAAVVALVVRAFLVGTGAARRAVAPLTLGWRLAAGGIGVVVLWRLAGTDAYLGLGIPGIVGAYAAPATLADVAWKGAFTVLTVGTGFPGGEVTPLFFVGASLGSALAGVLGVPVALGAGVGMASVFGAAARTPLALSILLAEVVGAEVLPHALLVSAVATVGAGSATIYPRFGSRAPSSR